MGDSVSRYVVQKSDTLEAAMLLIEENRHRSVVVLDDRGVVVGTLSDGDARKAILDRRLLSTPVEHVMNTNFVAVGSDERARAREAIERDHLFLIPIVDAEGKLLDIEAAY